MIRYNDPYNGERFLLNKKTKEIHDLENESSLCHINDIKYENLKMIDNADDMVYMCQYEGFDGCYWCNITYNKESIIY